MRGFTMVELIMVMIVIGILAAVAMPKFADRSAFEARGFQDETLALLRYAQKAAIAQHRTVCVRFTASQAWLTIRNASGSTACGAQASPSDTVPTGESSLTGPNGSQPFTVTAGSSTGYASGTSPFHFMADGKPSVGSNMNIAITGSGPVPVTVEAETGYVR